MKVAPLPHDWVCSCLSCMTGYVAGGLQCMTGCVSGGLLCGLELWLRKRHTPCLVSSECATCSCAILIKIPMHSRAVYIHSFLFPFAHMLALGMVMQPPPPLLAYVIFHHDCTMTVHMSWICFSLHCLHEYTSCVCQTVELSQGFVWSGADVNTVPCVCVFVCLCISRAVWMAYSMLWPLAIMRRYTNTRHDMWW